MAEYQVALTADQVQTIKVIAANLDNLRSGIAISEGEENDMAKDRRQVIIGWQENGTPITKDIRGNSCDEVNVKIATALIESGRMNDFIAKHFDFLSFQRKEECKVTLSEYVDRYMDTYLKGSIKDSSFDLYQKYAKIIRESIGKEPLCRINTERLQVFFNQHSNMSESTLKKIRGFLSPIFACAADEGIIDRNPINKRIRIKGVAEKSPDALSFDNIQKVLEIIEELPIKHRKMLVLLLFTGVRRGEMLGLQWRDIDTANGVIHVRRQIKHKGNRPVIDDDLKTINGKRDIPITGDIRMLLSLKGSDKDTDFIVSGSEPMTQKMYENAWQHTIRRRILEVTGLDNVTAHQLRHTYITYLESTGVDVKTLSAIAGHSDVAFTMKRYVSIQPEKIQQAGKMIEDVFSDLKLAQ